MAKSHVLSVIFSFILIILYVLLTHYYFDLTTFEFYVGGFIVIVIFEFLYFAVIACRRISEMDADSLEFLVL